MTADEIRADHKDRLEAFSDEDKLVMSREILAAMVRFMGKYAKPPVKVTRKESLAAIFETEAAARAAGAKPKVDFFLPLDQELPLQGLEAM